MVELKDMEAFLAVVEEGNISHAAARLETVQPALSRQMKRLESSLGVRLFERGSRGIRLTEAGRLLYSRAEKLLATVDATVREIAEIDGGVAGELRIGTIATSGALFLPELLGAFHKRYPKVTFQIWEGEGARILELLENRVIEIGITRTQVDEEVYESIALPDEPLMLAMRREFALSGETVRLEELEGKPLIVPLRWRDALISHARKAGFEPQLVLVSDSIVQDVLCAKMGLGVAILPISAKILLTDEEIVYRRLVEPEILTHTEVAWLKRRALSAAGSHLVELFREMYL